MPNNALTKNSVLGGVTNLNVIVKTERVILVEANNATPKDVNNNGVNCDLPHGVLSRTMRHFTFAPTCSSNIFLFKMCLLKYSC